MSTSSLVEGARGGRVTLVGQVGKAIVQLTAVIVLSRLLSPEDFGLIAMVTVISALGDLLRDFGLSTSGLQARNLTHQQASNLFWANAMLGGIAALVMVASTPIVVLLYSEPRLWVVTPVLAISLLINGLQAQLQVRLSRDHKYATLAFTDLGSQALALGVAAACALGGLGYWSLVAQSLTAAFALLISRVVCSRWIPLRPARGAGSKSLLVSGADFGLAHFLQFLASNTDTVAIGAFWGSTSLGYYNRAFQLLSQPVGRFLAPMMNVVIPTINSAKERGEDVHSHYLKIQGLAGTATTGVFCVAAASAGELIPVFLGEQWIPSVTLFQILAVGGVAQGYSQISYWIFITEGKSRELLKYNVITKLATVVAVAGAATVSVAAAAWAYSIALLVSWPINVLWLQRTGQFRADKFLRNGARTMFSGFTSAVLVMTLPLDPLGVGETLDMIIRISVSASLFVALQATTAGGRKDLKLALRAFHARRI